MGEKQIGVSQLMLVSNDDSPATRGRQLPQYAAALSATLGALAFGGVLGWSTACGDGGRYLEAEYGIPLSISEFSWIGSITNLGSAAICIPMGILMDIMGRKRSMLLLVIPYTIGWGLVIWSQSVLMFCVGRFLLGLSGGGFGVAVPVYTAEIGENKIRGRLGQFYELMLTSGILICYTLGTLISIRHLSIIFAVVPLVFFMAFSFMPESPTYFLMKKNDEEARASLLRVRGPEYDIDHELQVRKQVLDEELRNRGSFLKAIRSRVARNGVIIAYGLMFFQQLSGLNAIIFYTESIFGQNGSISSAASTIIVGALQVISTSISVLTVDRLGRKVLLLASIVSMTIGTTSMGIFYYLEHIGYDTSSYAWIPLISVCLFILMCSLGFSPIPFMMVGELFSPQIKWAAGSGACAFNWMMAFVVTWSYNDLVEALGQHVTFWMFAVVCAMGTVFVIFVVPETKGKPLEQIQRELGAKTVPLTEPVKA